MSANPNLTLAGALTSAAQYLGNLAGYAASLYLLNQKYETGDYTSHDAEDYERYTAWSVRDLNELDELFAAHPEVKAVFGSTYEALRTITAEH